MVLSETIRYEMTKGRIYNASEAGKLLGVGRATLYRWIKKGWVNDVSHDYKGDRIFTAADVKRIRAWKNMIYPAKKGGRKR